MYNIKPLFLTLFSGLLFLHLCLGAEEYEFAGHHLIASYLQCNAEALNDVDQLEAIMAEAVKASGVQILSSTKHVFPGNGLTMVFLLSESHASIHTYPEHNACFVDLFTCGHSCVHANFENILEAYLQPAQIDKHHFYRDTQTIEE